MNELAFPGRQLTPPVLRVAEERYYRGANRHAATSVISIRFAESESPHAEECVRWMIRRLDDAGMDGSTVAERAGQASSRPATPPSLCAAALLTVLEQGTIKGTSTGPEIVECDGNGFAIAVAYPGKSEVFHALDVLLDLFNSASHEPAEELESHLSELADDAYQPSLAVSLKAAEARGIPWMWRDDIRYYQLGHGRHRKRIIATITGNLSALGYDIARRKSLTNEILRSHAIPAPQAVEVENPDEAKAAAAEIGYPVVVKPAIGHKGIGITVGVKNARELADAFEKASKVHSAVVIERFIPGDDVRLLVVGDRLVAAARRCPARVTGDGRHSIAELIEIENDRRARNPGIALPIEVDEDLRRILKDQGVMLATVLDESEIVQLRKTANWSQGGTAEDLTEIVHPHNADMAVRAALAIGLDIAGVDFITSDISRPCHEVGGAICEVNYRPGLRVHLAADPEGCRDLGSPIVDSLFPAGNGRIPVIFILDADDDGLAAGLANRFSGSGRTAKLIDARGRPDDWQYDIDAALADPDCDALIVSTPSADIIDLGCGIDYCSHVIRFETDDPDQALACSILERISDPERRHAVREGDDIDRLLADLAADLDLRQMPPAKEPVSGEITTSRSMRVIAEAHGLPVMKRAFWTERTLFQFGYGANLSLYRGARTAQTSYIATRIADSKQRTNSLLRAHGLPHTRQTVTSSRDKAFQAAREYGYPVIVKPVSSSESRGVTGNILNDDEFAVAFDYAKEHSRSVIIEPFLQGVDHRFLIVGGRMVHVTRHEVAHVVGDGRMTIEQLIEKANENPLRGPDPWEPYTLLELDADATRMLARQGFSATTVLDAGQRAELSGISSLSVGATAEEVTGIAHADNIAVAEKAARLVGLDICGIDFLLPDVSKSCLETGGVILEVNQRPSFDMHDASTGSRNRVRDTILKRLLVGEGLGQIPIIHCKLDDEEMAEPIAWSVMQVLSSDHGLTGGAVVPGQGIAMIGSAYIAAGDSPVSSIRNAVLGDKRVQAALFLTGDKHTAGIPGSAVVMDFRCSDAEISVDAIAAAIVSRIIGQ
jgi:D-alanine-D-alanine ligase-like ATP-grasp enzyme